MLVPSRSVWMWDTPGDGFDCKGEKGFQVGASDDDAGINSTIQRKGVA
jgi:hypothetical protein